MKQWSKYFQNKEFLEKTRMHFLNRDLRDLVISYIGLKPGMKVLDVASGSGEFSFYLSEGLQNVEFIGIDIDEEFVKAANENVLHRGKGKGNTFHFIEGDAKSLPFESGTFDAVVSHTFFNSMPDYLPALNEMKRVVKDEGRVASITAMDPMQITINKGIYPKNADYWKIRYDELLEKVAKMYDNLVPLNEYANGLNTRFIPFVFSQAGLKDVSAYPLGQFFSLSNAAVSVEEKHKYILLDYAAESKKAKAVFELEGAEDFISETEMSEFLSLLETRRDYLLQTLGENTVWDWMGSANLLVTGTKRFTAEDMFRIMNFLAK